MLILLPPSETKLRPTAGRPLELGELSHPGLTSARTLVLRSLMATSARPDARDILGVPPRLQDAVDANTHLDTAPTAPALDVYTGVLYDALDAPSWDAATRSRSSAILIFSALFGVLTSTDTVPAYRLSGAVNLPGVGPLVSFWRSRLATLPTDDLIFDCRSGTYEAMWRPRGALRVRVFQERAGRRTVVTHMAKHARGLVARALLSSDPPKTRDEAVDTLRGWFATHPVTTATGQLARVHVETSPTSIDVITALT